MQKTVYGHRSRAEGSSGRPQWFRGLIKTLLVMKLIFLLMTAAFLQVHASAVSQSITLSGKDVPLKKVFDAIKKQTGFVVFSSEDVLTNARPVTLTVYNIPLADFLTIVLKNQQVGFDIKGKTITLSRENTVRPDLPEQGAVAAEAAFFPVTGMIAGPDGQPLSGINVTVKGSRTGTRTDVEGKFTLNAEAGSTLVISSIGYEPQEVKINSGSALNIVLKRRISALDESVVVGYGTTKRKDLTGSVASVNINEVKNVPFATIDQALTGKAAGVQVVQADGSPGGVARIRIRGGTSLLGGNDPLYIIDGVQVQIQNRYLQSAAEIVSPVDAYGSDNAGQTISGSFARGLNSLGGLNMNDVESIDILKDASATAIYGSRAANGVVIITTKKGKLNQKPVLEANFYSGLSNPIKEKLLDRDQYTMIMKEAAKNLNDARAASTPALTPDATATKILTDPAFLGTANTDWLDLVLRNGATYNADISVRGGGTGSRYYTSLAYNKNNGVVVGTDYSRIAGKVSLDNEINKRLRINTNLDYGFSTNNITNGMYTQALFAPPTINPYNADGSVKIITASANGTYGYEGFQNPLLLLKGVNKSTNASLIGSLSAEYDILKELKFRTSASVNYNTYRQTNYVPSTAQISSGGYAASSKNGIATQAQSQNVNVFQENTLTWDKQFNANNRLNLLIGNSWQITKTNSFSASGQGFPDDTYLNNLSSAALTLPSTGVSGQNSLLSFYMRANYALYEKYLITFTGRSDASSKFPENNRVGYFPSGGVAWRISQENFLKKATWIDELKLRASIGYTGTQNIADNLFYTLYSPVSYAGLNGLSPSQLGNDKIKWESTLQKDLGIDFQLFKSRLSGGIGYYEKSTSGVLFPAKVAGSAGFTNVTANIADIRNRGIELTLRGDFVHRRDFQWSGTFNISGNRSKVLALSNDFTDPSNPKTYTYGNTVLKVGQPLGLLYGYVFDGLLRSQKEVDDYASRNLYASYGFYPYLGIGDARYVLDPVTKFNKSDIIGHAEPKFYGGFTNNLTYKNFSLIALLTFSSGGELFYLADIQNADVGARTNKGVRILDRYTPENTTTNRPRLILGEGNNPMNGASNNVYDASFIKLKSVTLSYQFAGTLMNRMKMNGASVYVSATNLLTITNYPGADPEVSNDPYSLIGGYSDSGGYPTVRQFSFGLRFGF